MTQPLASLRQSLACAYPAAASETIALGAQSLDRRLGGGILRAALHEAYAETAADAPAATGFALALADRYAVLKLGAVEETGRAADAGARESVERHLVI